VWVVQHWSGRGHWLWRHVKTVGMSDTKTRKINTVNHKDAKKYKTANVAIRDMFYRKYHGVLYFRNILTFSHYTWKFNRIYAHKKNVAFPAQIFTNLSNAQQHYVHISYTAFTQIGQNFGSTNRYSFTPLKQSMAYTASIFNETRYHSAHFCRHLPRRILRKSDENSESIATLHLRP
jgi:hypothetical protein